MNLPIEKANGLTSVRPSRAELSEVKIKSSYDGRTDLPFCFL